MCGIVGIIGGADQQSQLKLMMSALKHRGPDDQGTFHSHGVSLGQTRLSIVDVEGGKQPILSQDQQLILVANGEIYNSPQLRKHYEEQGYVFRTQTDVEVILPLFQHYGVDCVKHLQGMFSFAIWDERSQRLFLARDHMGQKPLFYAKLPNGGFVFASEVKAILDAGLIKPELELEALWHYMSMRFVPDQYSFFKHINKLPAAHWLLLKDHQIQFERYWQADFTKKHAGAELQIVDELDELLQQTIDQHLQSDVKVGAFLSGGVDSGLVTSMMAKRQGSGVPVFSIGVQEQSYNELPFAKKVAEQYQMDYHAKVVEADAIHLIPKMIAHLDEPADPYGMGVYLVSELAKEQVKVVLTGDGGDESFAGYDRFIGQQLVDYYAWMPKILRKRVFGPLFSMLPDSYQYKTFAAKLRWLNDMSFYSAGDRYAQSMSTLRFTDENKQRLFSEHARSSLLVKNSFDKVLAHFDANNADDLVDKMLYTDQMTRLSDHLLVIADRMTMAHSLESRAPFVDYKLVEYAAAIPSAMKMKNRQLKYMLKQVALRYMPKEIVHRKKQGFGFPIAAWMRDELSSLMKNLFNESRFVELGIFNKSYIDELLSQHLAGKLDHNFRLWILLNLEIWYRMYFDAMTMDEINAEIQRWSEK